MFFFLVSSKKNFASPSINIIFVIIVDGSRKNSPVVSEKNI